MESLNFVAVDLETATSNRNSICEIGIAVVKDSEIVESKSWFVKLEGNKYDNFNMFIHHITPEMTENASSFPAVWKEVEAYLTDGVVVAHNSSFDMYVLRETFLANNVEFPNFKHFCSYRIAKYILKGCNSYSLPNVCEALSIPFGTHHRAEGDAIGCANVFIKCLELAEVDSLEELQRRYGFTCGEFTINSFKPQLSVRARYRGVLSS